VKIFFVNTLYTPHVVGGAELFVQSLAEGLVEVGHDAVVASTAPQRGNRVRRVNGVKVYYIGLKNLYWPFGDKENYTILKPVAHALDTYHPWMAGEVARILEAEQPSLVHTNNLRGFSVSAWRRVKQLRLPLVHTLHDHYLLCPRGTMFRRGKNCETRCAECRLYTLPRKHPSNQVSAVVGVSRFILERHLEFGYLADTPIKTVIPNSYQVELAVPRSDAPSLPIRFSYLGSVHPNKGLEVLLEAATKLPEGTWTLNVAGRGFTAYERDLHAKYGGIPAIKFLGYVDSEVLLQQTDVLVAPSLLSETFGRVVIEAYAHGVPVIASDRGGMPELVEAGRSGYLIDPSHPNHLTMKMQSFIDDPAMIEKMRPSCFEEAKRFVPANVVERYLDLYHDVCSQQ
jgi:glycosyltransferase involved in cell wall biosynthesis